MNNSTGSPIITFTLEIHPTHEWQLQIQSGILPKEHHILQCLPVFLRSVSEVRQVTNVIDNCMFYKGICDAKYQPLIIKHKGQFHDFSG